MISAGVVGLGIGNQHALAILESPYCRLSHLCEIDSQKVEQFKTDNQRQDIKHATYTELLQEKSLDMITIASFDDDHCQQVVDGLSANKHIFVEKPLCQTWEQLTQVHEIFKHNNCGLMSNLVLRTSELFQYVGHLIKMGELGEIFYFEGDYLYGRLHKITEGWRKDVKNYSVMEGGGIHMIDLMVSLTGQNPDSVFSVSNKIATHGSSFKYHDFHSSTFYFQSGLVGKITANFGCMHPHQHVVKVYGTKGTFIYDDQGPRIFKDRTDNVKAEPLKQIAKPPKKGLLIHDFVKIINQGDFSNAAQKEFDLMSMVLAAEESLKSYKKTEVKYLQC